MKSKILGLLAVGLLAGPMYANATDVSWDLNGVFTEKDPSGTANIPINVGDSFSFRLTYNPSGWVPTNGVAPANCTATRCQYDIPSLSLANQHYASLSPVDFGLDNPFFRLYNANAFPGVPGGVPSDGYFIRGFSDDRTNGIINYYEIFTFTFASPVVNFVNNTLLNGADGPTTLPPISSLQLATFNYCRMTLNNGQCDRAFLNGRFLPRFVPEPGSLALLGLGLAGLGLSRRRKA